MNKQKVLGGCLIAAPFLMILGYAYANLGILATISILAIACAMIGSIHYGVQLTASSAIISTPKTRYRRYTRNRK